MSSNKLNSRILIVDDIFSNIHLLLNILKLEGHDTEYAEDGKSALEIIEKQDFDLILLDVVMPYMSGFEVCSILKKNPAKKDTPVIFITAYNDTKSIAKGFEVGAVDFVTKPFNRKELLARINVHLELKKSKENLKLELKERKKAQIQLNITKDRLEMALDAGNLSWWDWNCNNNSIEYSSSFNKITDKKVLTYDDFINVRHPEDIDDSKKSIHKYMHEDISSFEIEYRIENKEGEWKWYRDNSHVIQRNKFNVPERIVGIINDITERKKSRKKLFLSEFKYRTIADHTYDWEFWIGTKGEFRYISPACEGISGYTPDDFINDESLFVSIVDERERDDFSELIDLSKKGITINNFDYRINTKNNTSKWLSMAFIPVLDDSSVFRGVRGSIRDITERKKSEEEIQEKNKELKNAYKKLKKQNTQISTANTSLMETSRMLKESGELYRTLVKNLPQIDVYVFDTKMQLIIIEGNDQTDKQNEQTSSKKKRIHEILGAPLKKYFDKLFKSALKGEHQSQEFFFNNNWYLHKVLPLKDDTSTIFGGLFVSQNISDQKAAIEAVKRSELKFRNVVEQAPDGIFHTNLDGDILEINSSFGKIVNFPKEALLKMNILQLTKDITKGDFTDFIKKLKTKDTSVIELELKRKNKSTVMVETSSKALSDGRIQGFVRDITERKKVEATLRKEREQFQKLMELFPSFICLIAPDYTIKYSNSKYKELFGESKSRHCYKSIRNNDTPCKKCHIQDMFAKPEPKDVEWTDSTGKTFLIQCRYFEDIDDSPMILEIGWDITTRKIAEEETKKSLEKQLQLNQLTSNFISTVSHEFRTPMSLISWNMQLLNKFNDTLEPDKKKSAYRRIDEAISIMTGILEKAALVDKDQRNLLEYIPIEFHFENFCNKLPDTLAALGALGNNNINIIKEINTEFGNVRMDKNLLEHILINILSNAIKFSKPNSNISFKVNLFETNSVHFQIIDSGLGIPTKDMENIFQPFHRGSNAVDIKGTGLGMSIVKSCVDLYKGEINILSKENEGTAVNIYLPVQISTLSTTLN